MAENLSGLGWVARVLVVIGALNWGLALFSWDVASWSAAGGWQTIVAIIYALVGLSGIWELVALFK